MRCFKRNFGKIGSGGPYFCVFRLRVLTSTIVDLQHHVRLNGECELWYNLHHIAEMMKWQT